MCDTVCNGLSQLATPSMRWKHCSRARQFLLSGKLQSHLNSPNFWIALWFWLPGMEKFTKKGSHLPWSGLRFCFALAASRSSGQSGLLQVKPSCSPKSLCRLLLPRGLGGGRHWEMGLGCRMTEDVLNISQAKL